SRRHPPRARRAHGAHAMPPRGDRGEGPAPRRGRPPPPHEQAVLCMTITAWLATFVFLAVYVLIATEKIHRVKAALLGAGILLLIHATDAESAFFSERSGVDWNVIFLLLGMMVIVGVLRRTGVFEYLAIWAAKRAKGRPFRLMVLLTLITAIASALLDNVT